MSSDSKLIREATAGVTKGSLDWATEKIKEIAQRFKNKEVQFIEDKETIQTVLDMRQQSEFKIFRRYVADKELRILCSMGLTLRRYEKEKKDLLPLKQKIRNTYGSRGPHIAYFVQNGLFSRFLGIAVEHSDSEGVLRTKITEMFEHVENRVLFVKNDANILMMTRRVVTKIDTGNPFIFVLSGSQADAMQLCVKIKDEVMKNVSDRYEAERVEAKNKRIYFLIAKDEELF